MELLKTNYQNELLATTIRAQEEESKRIAQDLHDELGATLAIIKMQMMMLEEKMDGTNASLIEMMSNSRMLAERALETVRNISHKLMPPQLEHFGLVNTMQGVISQLNSLGTYQVSLYADSYFPLLNWAASIALYRSLMELMNNTIRHARASTISIELHVMDGQVHCHYCDDGIGLDKVNPKFGLGLKSIEARVAALKGAVVFHNSTLTGGFTTTIQIPIHNT